jgi:hypothetical protein
MLVCVCVGWSIHVDGDMPLDKLCVSSSTQSIGGVKT